MRKVPARLGAKAAPGRRSPSGSSMTYVGVVGCILVAGGLLAFASASSWPAANPPDPASAPKSPEQLVEQGSAWFESEAGSPVADRVRREVERDPNMAPGIGPVKTSLIQYNERVLAPVASEEPPAPGAVVRETESGGMVNPPGAVGGDESPEESPSPAGE